MESIIRDTTKYHLVLFSASWCKPCRDEIPLLKQIYNDLKGKLEMVYVSMDEPDTASNWQKLMEKERVSWRSVLAAHDTGSIKRMYCVDGIPQIYLVHPGTNKVELIDINLPLQKQRLYQLINALP
jgi:thiol-disulfide isomerase/thioredoxin